MIDQARDGNGGSRYQPVRNAGGLSRAALFLGILAVLFEGVSMAQDPGGSAALKVDTGDTAWMLMSSALVLLMLVPGLALFYGGLVRSKNVLGTIMQSFVILSVVSLLWIVFGYSLAFGPDRGGIIGGLEWAGLSGVGAEPHPVYGPTIPHTVFFLFQMMFAAITPALIAGAFAERKRFSAMLLFSALWSIVVYVPLAHWMWGGGWLAKMGALDFAGGAVIHISSGVAALVCAIVLGKRRGYGSDYMGPHNLPMTLLGAGLLWFGWFGFNGGSALGANGVAASAIVATHAAACMAAVVWCVVEWVHRGKPTVLGVASGAVAGLATVTPASGYIGPFPALVIGAIAGLACYFAIVWKGKFGYDDSLDVVGIHGVGGVCGILATGLFASKAINAGGADGLLFGNPSLLGVQFLTVIVVAVFSGVGTFALLKIVGWITPLRVEPEEESTGLDLSQHNERAYS
ncbi:MAG: ammonium transporter [Nitrospira sp.]|nr:ammonium transporter [Nitrospira sp.]